METPIPEILATMGMEMAKTMVTATVVETIMETPKTIATVMVIKLSLLLVHLLKKLPKAN